MREDNLSHKVTSEVVSAIASVVGNGNVKTLNEGPADALTIVVKPADAQQVSKVVAAAAKTGAAVITKGKCAKSCDAVDPKLGAVIIDMDSMNKEIIVDKANMIVKAQAGCVWKDIIDACDKEGFIVCAAPFNFSEMSIGNWASTYGLTGYKYGGIRQGIMNLEVVLPDGTIMNTGYDKIGNNMSGYNLNQVFAGAEGTLGVLVAISLRLTPKGDLRYVAYKFNTLKDADAPIQKIVGHPSVKPLYIAFDGKDNQLLCILQGDSAFIDLEEKAIDEICAEAGKKVAADAAAAAWEARCAEYRDGKMPYQAAVEVQNWSAFVDECKGEIFGTIADRSTAVFAFADEAAFADSKLVIKELAAKKCGKIVGIDEFLKTVGLAFDAEDADSLSRKVKPEVIEKLKEIVGEGNVNTCEMDRMLYGHDLAPLPKEAGMAFKNAPDVIVRPKNTKQVSEIAALAFKYGIAVVPRGASTWGLGGSMPVAGGILLDMSATMNKIVKIDKANMCVRAQAGCTWGNVLDACAKEGLLLGSTPSSFPSATLGGWTSTGGIGIGGYKYGGAKENLMNLEVVLSDGTVINTGSDIVGNDMSEYNLNQIFAGAEGTLGIITEVTLRIYPKGEMRFLGYDFDKLKDMNGPIQKIVNHPSLKPLHIAWSDSLHFENQRKAGLHAPDVSNLFLCTLQGEPEFMDLEEKLLDEICAEAGGRKVSSDIPEHEWAERCYEYRCRKAGVGSIPAEVVVETQHWGDFVDECYAGFKTMKMEPGGIVGMISDRSTAMFMPYYFKDDEKIIGMTAFSYNFYMGDRAMVYGGRSMGLGVFFASNLDVIRDAPSASYIRDIKTVMDPHDVVNPGHLVCGKTKLGINLSAGLMGIAGKLMIAVKKLLPKDRIFESNIDRFYYDELEEEKLKSLVVTYGKGTQ